MHAALSLVLTLFGVAVHFVAMEAHFLAAVQVIVYAGAIVVLFLFVIMLLGVDQADDLRIEPFRSSARWRPSSASASIGLRRRSARSCVADGHRSTRRAPPLERVRARREHPPARANLFSDHVFAFELTSVLLIVAVAGTVVMTRKAAIQARDDATSEGDRRDRRRRARRSTWYLLLAAVLFGIGAIGVLVRRNPLVMFMCIELMLNAANLTFVALSRCRLGDISGQTSVFFVLVVAAAEVVVGLGIIVSILRRRPGATADDLAEMKG